MQWEINHDKEISFDLTNIIVKETEGNKYSSIVQGKYFENTGGIVIVSNIIHVYKLVLVSFRVRGCEEYMHDFRDYYWWGKNKLHATEFDQIKSFLKNTERKSNSHLSDEIWGN